MTTNSAESHQPTDDPDPIQAAAIYARVSSSGQLGGEATMPATATRFPLR